MPVVNITRVLNFKQQCPLLCKANFLDKSKLANNYRLLIHKKERPFLSVYRTPIHR